MNKVIIVGAGIAGLAAGVYARQSGFDVTVYEAHAIPGGASTSWKRGGYLFEGGMHWLTGSSPKTPLHKLWLEVGALGDHVKVHCRDPFNTFEVDGQTACLYRDVDRLRAHLTTLSPEDAPTVDRLCRDIRKLQTMQMPISDIKGVKTKAKSGASGLKALSMLPALARIPHYAGQTMDEYVKRFHSRLLRHLFLSIVGEECSATAMVFTLATLTNGDGGYPEGGSLDMARRMADRLLTLGGRIEYKAQVDKVVVKGGAAQGVEIRGESVSADAVIVTQDTLSAVAQLFDEPINEPWLAEMRRETKPMVCTFLGIGARVDLSGQPENFGFLVQKPFFCGDQEIRVIGFNQYADYPGYAPEGGTALTCGFMGDTYDFWKQCRNSGRYAEEKEKLAMHAIDALIQKYPQFDGKVEVWDVATPLTYERYLQSFHGSWMSVMGKNIRMRAYPLKSESIGRLYFAGQRLMPPGGLPGAAETGRRAVQHLCLDDDRVFQGDMSHAQTGD